MDDFDTKDDEFRVSCQSYQGIKQDCSPQVSFQWKNPDFLLKNPDSY